ncbi:MAG: hypothetical protein ACR2G6_15760 [Gemmatimonadaceae bacterium]
MADNRRLVLIEWEDSHSVDAWQELGERIEDRALVCRSVGWLVLDGKRAKVVAPHLNEQEPGVPLQGGGVMTIPTRAVLRMVDLREANGEA